MSKLTFKPIIFRLTCVVLVISAFIIYSCKKDNKAIAIDPDVKQAMDWYESAYPVSGSTVKTRFSPG
jgi:hypothetical protein